MVLGTLKRKSQYKNGEVWGSDLRGIKSGEGTADAGTAVQSRRFGIVEEAKARQDSKHISPHIEPRGR